jgi:hypothetical protein
MPALRRFLLGKDRLMAAAIVFTAGIGLGLAAGTAAMGSVNGITVLGVVLMAAAFAAAAWDFTNRKVSIMEDAAALEERAADVEEAAAEYLRQPVNFGSDTHSVRAAEHDAFVAGAQWAVNR